MSGHPWVQQGKPKEFSSTIRPTITTITKVTLPKAKGAKPDSSGGSTSYSIKQGGEDKCWKCGGFHKKKDCSNPPQATTSNPNPNQPCSHCYAYGHDADHCFTLHLELRQG
jgi:hypothetical protein